MMGHMACRVLGATHDVVGTIRGDWNPDSPLASFLGAGSCVSGLDVLDSEAVARVLDEVEPDAVLNCVGIVKQLSAAKDAVASIECNSLLPHRLALLTVPRDVRLIHLSTDCVFSGRDGEYSEDDVPDPVDLYGRSKLLGEIGPEEGLTIRTSIVGRQIAGATSFFEWILSNRGKTVQGFERAVYSGLTTMALSRIVSRILDQHPTLGGVWQVASEPITKFELIVRLNDLLDLKMDVVSDATFVCDRSLDGSRFVARTGLVTPNWDSMLADFALDQSAYPATETTR